MAAQNQNPFRYPQKSYWMDSTSIDEYPILSEDINVDVVIVGGGITGISTAYELIKHGVKVAILEADHILNGTTGHTTAKITSQHGLLYHKIKSKISEELAKQYATANETAIKILETRIKESNIECDFTKQSAYIYTLQENYIDKIRNEVTAASSLGINAQYLEDIPLKFPVKAAIRFDDQAQFHPLKYLQHIVHEYTSHGGLIFEQSRVVTIEHNDNYTLTTLQGKKVIAEKVIIASHYPFYNKHGAYFSRICPEKSYVVAITMNEKYPGGMYLSAEEPKRSLRSQIYNENELILIGGENHKTGQGEDTTKHYEALIDYATTTFTVKDIPYRWSTQDCMTLDDLPYVGHYTSDTPNLYVATGYGKWGMTNSIASSILLKDLIMEGHSPWEDVYNPSRHDILASSKNFIVENLDVAKELIKGKFSPLPLNVEIKNGEGKVIEDHGQRVGAYRDENGVLHVVNTTCPHMGCEVNWNSAEKSWDCPCHGSRFSIDGEIIEGPSVHPLDKDNNVNTIKKLINEDF